MAVEKFEVGKSYRFIGKSSFSSMWNEDMDKWKDGKPRVCLSEKDHSTTHYGMGQYCGFADIRDEWLYLGPHRVVFEKVLVGPVHTRGGAEASLPTEDDIKKRVLSDL